ncbi:tripartite tricarboxylate transporter substrate binding protein [Cereibacter sphaeroides]|nr:tripartite tricarboxylate transporter substrate binding protein [Cereibacter sphaeroides]
MTVSQHMRPRARFLAAAMTTTILGLGLVGSAQAQDVNWPRGAVRMIVPIAPGGGTDAVARMIAGALQESTGSPFVVVNQPAGGGGVAVDTVLRARPDGQTLFFFNSAIIHRAHTGMVNASPSEDFTALAFFPVSGSYCLGVSAESPYETLDALLEASRAAPDTITFGVQLRSGSHFGGALLQRETESAFRFVQGGGDSDLTVAIEGGNIDTGLISCRTAVQHQEAGQMRILSVINRTGEADPTVPDIANIAEQGYPGVNFSLDFLLLGPKDMDPALVGAINTAFADVVASETIATQLTQMRIPMVTLSVEDSATTLAESDQVVADLAAELGFE